MLENQMSRDFSGRERDLLAAQCRFDAATDDVPDDETQMIPGQSNLLPSVLGRYRLRGRIIAVFSRIRARRRDVALRVRFRSLSAIALAIATLVVLAGCGGSGSDQTAAAVKRCQQRGASHGACQCAVSYASAHGDPPAKLIREMTDGSAARDPVAVQAGTLCVGAK